MKRNTFPALPYASAVLVVLAAGILMQSTSAGAQEKYPSKAITIVVPYPPGGSNDSFELWWGLLAPADTPPAVVNRLNAVVNKILGTPEMKQFFLREGAEPAIASPSQFAAQIAGDIARYQQIAKQATITAE